MSRAKTVNVEYGVSVWQWAGIAAMAGFVALPLYVTATGGFKSTGELRTRPFALPASNWQRGAQAQHKCEKILQHDLFHQWHSKASVIEQSGQELVVNS